MPKYLIRRNLNGRPLNNIVREYPTDECAVLVAMNDQETLNTQFKSMREKGMKPSAVPVVEVLKLIYQGEPFRVDPERIRKRREKIEAIQAAERQELEESWITREESITDLRSGDL